MGTKIQSHHTLDELFDRLALHPLSPAFEDYGNFINTGGKLPPGHVSYFGNFWTYSHAFQVVTDDPVLITRLTMAVRANQATPAYQAARVAYGAERERYRKECEDRERARDDERRARVESEMRAIFGEG